ncbi:hypothetical protein [Vibrio sp.]|uniref:hypothetical protein n=1 Tax=Vibrio sp. TaxID=678 RepID=UPI00311EEFEB
MALAKASMSSRRHLIPSVVPLRAQRATFTALSKAPIGTQQLIKQREQAHAKSYGIASLIFS